MRSTRTVFRKKFSYPVGAGTSLSLKSGVDVDVEAVEKTAHSGVFKSSES